MGFDTSGSDELAGGGNSEFLKAPGKYHVLIADHRCNRMAKDTIIDGNTLDCVVQAGTTKDQEDKKFGLTFHNPKITMSDKGKSWFRRKISALLVACNLIEPAKLGGTCNKDWPDMVGSQIIVDLVHDDDGKFLDLNFANIYHVDDPRVADVPKNQAVIDLLPPDKRHGKEYFACLLERTAATPAATSGTGDSSALKGL